MFVWIDMLEGDNATSAADAAQAFPVLPNITHFHDPDRVVGKEVARRLGAPDRTAWDFYLLYAKGLAWTDHPPAPLRWFHQLRDDPWAGPGHYRWGQGLRPAIRDALDVALGFRAA